MTESIYANLKPSIFKKGHYPDADMALYAYMRDVLFAFIEEECGNGDVEYHQGGKIVFEMDGTPVHLSNILSNDGKVTAKKGAWDDFFDGKEDSSNDIVSQVISDDEEKKTYRGIGRAHLAIDEKFTRLIDLYWFFKVELGKLETIINDDWFKAHGRPFAKEDGPFIRHEVTQDGRRKVVINKKGKVPGYNMKFSYKGTPDSFIQSIKIAKLKELLDLSTDMWI